MKGVAIVFLLALTPAHAWADSSQNWLDANVCSDFSTDTWCVYEIPVGTESPGYLAATPDGLPLVAYNHAGCLWLGTLSEGSWRTTLVTDKAYLVHSISTCGSYVHIVAINRIWGSNPHDTLAVWTGSPSGPWTKEIVSHDCTVYSVEGLVVTPDQEMWLLGTRQTSHPTMFISHSTGSGWTREDISTNYRGDLAMDPDHQPHMALTPTASGVPLYHRFLYQGTWWDNIVASGSFYPFIAMDNEGFPHIVSLRTHYWNTAPGWVNEVFLAVNEYARDIAIGPDGIVWVAAYDGLNQDFVACRFDGSQWINEHVGWEDQVSSSVSVAVGGDGVAWFLYYALNTSRMYLVWLGKVVGTEGRPTEQISNGFSLHPNPATTYVSFQMDSQFPEPAQLQFFDLTGRSVGEAEIPGGLNQHYSLDVTRFPVGVYFVRWVQGSMFGERRFAVTR